jgi:hypothetical protein
VVGDPRFFRVFLGRRASLLVHRMTRSLAASVLLPVADLEFSRTRFTLAL